LLGEVLVVEVLCDYICRLWDGVLVEGVLTVMYGQLAGGHFVANALWLARKLGQVWLCMSFTSTMDLHLDLLRYIYTD